MTKKSNIELFRIILFLMVVSIHVTSVGLVLTSGGIPTGTLQWYYASLTRLFVAPAILCFVLISGYLMVNKEVNTRAYLKRLGKPFILYLPLLLLFDYSIYNGRILDNLSNVGRDIISVSGGFHHLWYVLVVAVVAVFIPFINKLLKYCSEKQHLTLVVSLLFIVIINPFGILMFNKPLFLGLLGVDSRISLFITMYIVGAYFGKYKIKLNRWLSLLFYSSIPVAVLVCSLYSNTTVIKYIGFTNFFVIAQGIFLFLFFTQLDFKSIRVNYLGGLVYGAYINHVIFISYLQKFLPFTTFLGHRYYPIVDVAFVAFVAFVSLMVEASRLYLFNHIIPKKAKLIDNLIVVPEVPNV